VSWADGVRDEGAWLRHVPTQVIVWKHGRSDAEAMADLADILAQHRVITEDERASAHAAAGT
jgi:hypothetical protein